MRRLVALTSTIIAVDAMLFTALAPLIPGYAAEFGLSKAGAGLLVGAFGAGALFGGAASGFAAIRYGPKPLVVVGLCILSSPASHSRLQEARGRSEPRASCKASRARRPGRERSPGSRCGHPSARRGEIIGLVFGFAVAGAVDRPDVRRGRARDRDPRLVCCGRRRRARHGGRGRRQPGRPEGVSSTRCARTSVPRSSLSRSSLAEHSPGDVLRRRRRARPARLSKRGFSTLEIGVVFFGAGLLEVGLNPILGRLSDRRGRLGLIRLGLAGSAVVSLLLANVGSAAAVTAVYVVSASSRSEASTRPECRSDLRAPRAPGWRRVSPSER